MAQGPERRPGRLTTCCSPTPTSPGRRDTLRRLVAAAEGDDRDLVSQMALLRAATGWERVVVPAFVYFFAQLYPFRRVNVPGSRTAAAVARLHAGPPRGPGQGRRPGADPRRPHRRRGPGPPDQAASAGAAWLGLSRQVVSVRPYPGWPACGRWWPGRPTPSCAYSPVLLAGTLIGLLFLYALPPAGCDHRTGRRCRVYWRTGAAALTLGAGLARWALMSLSYLPMLRLYRLSPLRAPGLPLIALLYAAMTADSARRHYAGRGAEWRGRTNLR